MVRFYENSAEMCYNTDVMNIIDCQHVPKNLAKPRAQTCEDCGDKTAHFLGLRACLTCGYVGCCESDPNQHVLKHVKKTGHQVIASYPADENSFLWCYEHNDYLKKSTGE